MIDIVSIIAIWLSSSPLRFNDGFQIEFFMCKRVYVRMHVCMAYICLPLLNLG